MFENQLQATARNVYPRCTGATPERLVGHTSPIHTVSLDEPDVCFSAHTSIAMHRPSGLALSLNRNAA